MTVSMGVREQCGHIKAAYNYRCQQARTPHAVTSIKPDYLEEGVVVISPEGQVCGWCRSLPFPHEWRPGSILVNADRVVFVAVGGDDYNGAHEWQQAVYP